MITMETSFAESSVHNLAEAKKTKFKTIAKELGTSKMDAVKDWLLDHSEVLKKGAAVTDVVLGVVSFGFGYLEKMHIRSISESITERNLHLQNRSGVIRAKTIAGAITGGMFIGLQPIRRITDAMLLRIEPKNPARQMLVGSATAR